MKSALFIALLFVSFTGMSQNKGEKKQSDITTCQLVEKAFIMKNGEVTDNMELYLRCSVQDYFIKVCECSVTREELEKYIDQGISVKMEIREGEWDRCKQDLHEMQSRIGTYAVIKSIE